MASWYGGNFHGRQTANGEIFDTNAFTAAHKKLPFNTVVTVVNLDNFRRTQVRINDRGPFVAGRVIDLSRAAADALGMIDAGTAQVRLEACELEAQGSRTMLIQLGSYRDRANAALFARKIQEGGLNPDIEFSRGFYRVVIRGLPEEKVEGVKAALADLGVDDVLVRREP